MRRFIVVLLIALSVLAFVSCGASRVADLNSLSLGMSKQDVVDRIGRSERVLAINATESGLQEILEFRTYYNEVYAVEFIDDRMVGYEFLYDDSSTIVTGTMVPVYPVGPNRPVYPVQPNRPTYPNRPSRPNNNNRPPRPTEPERPNPPRPSEGVGTTRPVGKPVETVRPSTRPTTREVQK